MRATLPALLLALAAPAAAQTAGTLLVGNKGEDSLNVVDLRTGREVRRVPTGRMPHEIALSPDGRRAAVTAYGGRTIELFALSAGSCAGSVDLDPNARPHGLLWLSGDRLLATAEGRDALMLVIFSGPEPTVAEIATGAEGSHMVAVSPD